jgi:hypothetical protein
MRNPAMLIALLFLAAPLPAGSAQAAPCNGSEIMVEADEAACKSVCDAVQIGETFLKSIGLQQLGSLSITLFKELPRNGKSHSIGYYNSRSNEICLLDYETILDASRQSPPAFGVLMSPAIWRSYVIHELAHAAAQKMFASGVSVCTASEYIASVAQLATLPSSEREKILSNYPELSGFDRPEEITMAFYLLDPSKFAVNAYLHFSKPENGLLFIKRLLREGLPVD